MWYVCVGWGRGGELSPLVRARYRQRVQGCSPHMQRDKEQGPRDGYKHTQQEGVFV